MAVCECAFAVCVRARPGIAHRSAVGHARTYVLFLPMDFNELFI